MEYNDWAHGAGSRDPCVAVRPCQLASKLDGGTGEWQAFAKNAAERIRPRSRSNASGFDVGSGAESEEQHIHCGGGIGVETVAVIIMTDTGEHLGSSDRDALTVTRHV